MYKKYFLKILILISIIACENNNKNKNQRNTVTFNDTLPQYSEVLNSFTLKMKEKYDSNYTDKIWEHHADLRAELIGSRIDNFSFIDIKGHELNLYDIKKPIVLEATASWCGPCKASIPVINQLSSSYQSEVQFVLISHDERKKATDYADKYVKEIIFIPSDKELDAMLPVKAKASEFELMFPFPTAFFIDENKVIVNIKTGGVMPGTFPMGSDTLIVKKTEAEQRNFDILNDGILEII